MSPAQYLSTTHAGYYGEGAQRPASWFATVGVAAGVATTALVALGVVVNGPVNQSVSNFVAPAAYRVPMVAQPMGPPMAPQPMGPPMRPHTALGGVIDAGDIRKGVTIEVDGAPYKIIDFQASKQARQAAVIRTKMLNMITGNSVEKSFRSGEKVDKAEIEYSEVQFTYIDEGSYVFTNMETFEEERLSAELLGDQLMYLSEGMTVNIAKFDGKAIDMQLPNTLDLEVIETEPGEQGDRANAGSKPATVAGGKVIQVPLFITVGQMVRVDTREDRYITRV